MRIEIPEEFNTDAHKFLTDSFKTVCNQLHDKYGNTTPFPALLHIYLIHSMTQVLSCAPDDEQALKFIEEGFEAFKDAMKIMEKKNEKE